MQSADLTRAFSSIGGDSVKWDSRTTQELPFWEAINNVKLKFALKISSSSSFESLSNSGTRNMPESHEAQVSDSYPDGLSLGPICTATSHSESWHSRPGMKPSISADTRV